MEGWDVTILWEGILVRDLIRHAGPHPGQIRSIFTAHDGYTTSFPLDYLMNRDIIMAYRMNNITLPAERGYPFELVAEDKWGYKWIKWIEKIELTDDPAYKGYWESRGFSNTGDLKEFRSELRNNSAPQSLVIRFLSVTGMSRKGFSRHRQDPCPVQEQVDRTRILRAIPARSWISLISAMGRTVRKALSTCIRKR